jgi:hypothetical protein
VRFVSVGVGLFGYMRIGFQMMRTLVSLFLDLDGLGEVLFFFPLNLGALCALIHVLPSVAKFCLFTATSTYQTREKNSSSRQIRNRIGRVV